MSLDINAMTDAERAALCAGAALILRDMLERLSGPRHLPVGDLTAISPPGTKEALEAAFKPANENIEQWNETKALFGHE